jgi:hypothetical protein
MKRDYRVKPRRPVFYGAWLRTGNGAEAMPCIFTDVSEDGARVKVVGAEDVPAIVELMMSERAEGRRCHVVWRSKSEVGLRFDMPATAGNARRR